MIGIEPEVVRRSPPNRIRILILGKRFRIPGYRIWSLSNTPWGAAISSISLSSIVCPAGMLRRSVKTDVAYINSGIQGHAEGLNSAVEIHVKQRILIVPYAGRRGGYLVAHQPNTIVTRIGLNLIDYGAGSCPGLDSRLHSDRGSDG